VGNHHRLLRRGRSYGPRLPVDKALAGGDGAARGLYFMCLNTNLPRQFEFVQQTWARSPKFGGLYDQPDPILAGGSFSIPTETVRRRLADVPRFVTVRGGAYLFLPGIRAVRYLAGMGVEPGNSSSPVGS
jgi:deferrochelatase/peroxidase EfeB